MVLVKDYGKEEMRTYCLISIELEFYEIKRVTEIDGDVCTTL